MDLAAIPSVFLWVQPHPPLNQMINYSVKWLVTANVGIWSVGVWFANCSAGLCHGEFGFATYPFGDHVTSLMFSSRLYLDFFFHACLSLMAVPCSALIELAMFHLLANL